MPHVVITGGTRGLGRGLARAFAAKGCRVTIGGRTQEGVDRALLALGRDTAPDRIAGHVCDVAVFADLEALWRAASERAPVDIWVNNAGHNEGPRAYWDMSPDEVRVIVEANLTGTMLAALVAVRGMRLQGHGTVYNLEGLGADGRARVPGLLTYGTSKAGVGYFSRGLAAEIAAGPVKVCTIDPGIVITGMLRTIYTDPSHLGGVRRIIEALAQPVEVVAPRLATRALANRRSGVRIRPFGVAALVWRLLLAPFVRRPLDLETSDDP